MNQEVLDAKNEAIDRAQKHANAAWTDDAVSTIYLVASLLKEFTTDAIWPLIKAETHEPRAMGAAMRIALKEGMIVPTSKWKASSSKINHGRPQRVWRSLRYKE